jgi:RNA ligase (TIGR02306 family)
MPKGSLEHEQEKVRVRATRLRGERSFGTVMTLDDVHNYLKVVSENTPSLLGFSEGDELTEELGITKYTPPERVYDGDAEKENSLFPKYTDIERYQNYPRMLCEGEPVAMLEKGHGSNSRVGLIYENNEMVWAGGSHNLRRKQYNNNNKLSLYWWPLLNIDGMKPMIEYIQKQNNALSVVVFSEILGDSIQDMTYNGYIESLVFDICINSKFINWCDVKHLCEKYSVPIMPELYVGPFSHETLMLYTDGKTHIAENPQCSFRGREGVVVKPLIESVDNMGRRRILKSVSVDFLARKNAQDNA